jgi:hypothetical protein
MATVNLIALEVPVYADNTGMLAAREISASRRRLNQR